MTNSAFLRAMLYFLQLLVVVLGTMISVTVLENNAIAALVIPLAGGFLYAWLDNKREHLIRLHEFELILNCLHAAQAKQVRELYHHDET